MALGPPIDTPPSAKPRSKAGTWPLGTPQTGTGARFESGYWTLFVLKLQEWLRAEAGPGRMLPWVPVAFGIGIALYFTADREPLVQVVAPVAVVACGLAALTRRHRMFPAAVMIAAVFAGFATATIKSAWVSHTVLARTIPSVALKGFVETHEERERTDRFVLRVAQMDAGRPAPKIERVRLSVRKGTAPSVGSFVELKAKLQPPLSAMRPGSYDFGRDMYFQGLGASGFVLGSIKTSEPASAPTLGLRYSAWMQNARDAVDARIRTVLSGDERSIATALLTGRRDAISTPVNDAMFISGLGHVLSISGYHMAVVAGVVFFAVRALLALSPALTASFAIKKWSAFAALIAALFYLLLSGAEVATQRSFYMTAIVLVAIMADRRAITFRTLSIAALVVLTLAPEALVHPSFQMSFAATLGLVVLAQVGLPRIAANDDQSPMFRIAAWGGRELMMLTLASFIAGLATTPYAAFHFHRITPYGVLANLAAMPVVSALVMPAGLLGILAIPFGFDGIFWHLMGIGIDWMIAVTRWVAALPGAIGRVTAFGTGPLIAMSAGIILLGLLRSPLRWIGAGVLAGGTIWAGTIVQPDILVASDGRAVGVRNKDGTLRIMSASKDAFLVREWLAADADERAVTNAQLKEGVSCDDAGCVTQARDDAIVALTLKPEALADDCPRASVIVTTYQPPGDCSALIIDRDMLKARGAVMLTKEQAGYSIQSLRPRGVNRPWSPATPDVASTDPQVVATRLPREQTKPIDATPSENDLRADD